jgi:hypothetical protein
MDGESNGLGLAIPLGRYQRPAGGATGSARAGVKDQDGPPMFWITMAGPHSQSPDVVGTTVTVFHRGDVAATVA